MGKTGRGLNCGCPLWVRKAGKLFCFFSSSAPGTANRVAFLSVLMKARRMLCSVPQGPAAKCLLVAQCPAKLSLCASRPGEFQYACACQGSGELFCVAPGPAMFQTVHQGPASCPANFVSGYCRHGVMCWTNVSLQRVSSGHSKTKTTPIWLHRKPQQQTRVENGTMIVRTHSRIRGSLT